MDCKDFFNGKMGSNNPILIILKLNMFSLFTNFKIIMVAQWLQLIVSCNSWKVWLFWNLK